MIPAQAACSMQGHVEKQPLELTPEANLPKCACLCRRSFCFWREPTQAPWEYANARLKGPRLEIEPLTFQSGTNTAPLCSGLIYTYQWLRLSLRLFREDLPTRVQWTMTCKGFVISNKSQSIKIYPHPLFLRCICQLQPWSPSPLTATPCWPTVSFHTDTNVDHSGRSAAGHPGQGHWGNHCHPSGHRYWSHHVGETKSWGVGVTHSYILTFTSRQSCRCFPNCDF